MFKDTEEELQRLQQELLEDEPEEDTPEETEEEASEEEYLEEEQLDELLEDTAPSPQPGIYRNYSNDYGKGLRNYASGYRAYNADTTDTDLDEFSRRVEEEPRKTGKGLLVAIALLTVAILAVLGYLWVKYRGVM